MHEQMSPHSLRRVSTEVFLQRERVAWLDGIHPLRFARLEAVLTGKGERSTIAVDGSPLSPELTSGLGQLDTLSEVENVAERWHDSMTFDEHPPDPTELTAVLLLLAHAARRSLAGEGRLWCVASAPAVRTPSQRRWIRRALVR
jgi:hypothetical protein